jgi:hypothetical protein
VQLNRSNGWHDVIHPSSNWHAFVQTSSIVGIILLFSPAIIAKLPCRTL